MSLKDTILAAKDISLEPMVIPEWGVTVFIPVMTLDQVMTRDVALKDIKEKDFFIHYATYILLDETGQRIFTADDVGALKQKSAAIVKKIVARFNQLNGLDQEDEDSPKNALKTQVSDSK